MKCLPIIPGKKLNNILMCVMPLIVPILWSTEHIRNSVKLSVGKHIDFSKTLYG